MKLFEPKFKIFTKHQYPSFSHIFDIILRKCWKLGLLRCQYFCGLFSHYNDQHFESFRHAYECRNTKSTFEFRSIICLQKNKPVVDLFFFPFEKANFTFFAYEFEQCPWRKRCQFRFSLFVPNFLCYGMILNKNSF